MKLQQKHRVRFSLGFVLAAVLLAMPAVLGAQDYYRVRAFNAGGTSTHTDVVSARTLRK